MPSSHLILRHPLLLLLSVFLSIRVFSSESSLRIRWLKYWSFSFRYSSSSEYSGFISFRLDWLDLLAVQGTLKSLLQQHNSKSSGLQHSALFWSSSHIHTFPVSPDISSESFSTEESRKLSPIDQSEKVLCYPWHIAFRSFFSYSTSTNLFGDLQEE